MSTRDFVYIEDFFRGGPDWANGYAAGGDSTSDWIPSLFRATTRHLDRRADPDSRGSRKAGPIILGRDLMTYPCASTLHLFGASLEGLATDVALEFTSVSRGVHLHYGTSGVGTSGQINGTSAWLSGIWEPFRHYGGPSDIRRLTIDMNAYVGSVGIVVQNSCTLDDVSVVDAGWHGIHVTAGADRGDTVPETTEYPGRSNANRVTLRDVSVTYPSRNPGASPFWVTAANPTGQRPFGCGMKVQGGDANNLLASRFYCGGRDVSVGGAMGWAVDDDGFLGGTYLSANSTGCERYVTQVEHDIIAGTFGSPTEQEIQEFAHPLPLVYDRPEVNPNAYDVDASTRVAASYAVGEKINFSFRARGARTSQWLKTYVETQTPYPVIDIRHPHIHDVGPEAQGKMTWNVPSESYDDHDESIVTIAEGAGQLITVDSDLWTNAIRATAIEDYLRMDLGNSNNNVVGYVTAGAPTVDGRTLTNGRLILADFYRARGFPGGSVQSAMPRALDALADLPDLSVEATATANPIGSIEEIIDPIEGGSIAYASVADATATNGIRWSPIGQLRPLNRGMFDNAQTDRPTLATRTVSLARASGVAGFSFVSGGIAYRKTSTQSIAFADVTGIHWIYFNASGDLAVLENPTEAQVLAMLRTNAPVAVVYWHTTDGAVLLADERHTQAMTPEQHLALHRGVGARISRTSGLGFAEITVPDVDDATPDDGDAQISIAGCMLLDEDLEHPSDATSQTLSPIAQLPTLYRSGATGEWRVLTAWNFPLAYDGHGMTTGQRAGWNQWTGSTWQLTEIGNGNYSYTIVISWNDTRTRYAAIVGQDDAATSALARTGAEAAILSLSHGQLPFPEFKIVGALIFQTSSSYSNTTKTRWISVDTAGTRWLDWRRNGD